MRFARRRGIGLGMTLAIAASLATLQGCGGSGDAGADKAAAAVSTAPAASATAAPPTGEITTVDADVRAKVLYAGSTKGFVATALAASMPTGTEGDYDVLVVGDADQGGDAVVALVQQALASGKEVVLDAAGDGSDRRTHADILQKVVGTRIEASAVRIKKAVTGYYITPIDAPSVAEAKAKTAGARGVNAPSNSVQSVFGIGDSEVTQ